MILEKKKRENRDDSAESCVVEKMEKGRLMEIQRNLFYSRENRECNSLLHEWTETPFPQHPI